MRLFATQNKLKVKICGITNLEDINICINSGIDALGFLVKDEKKGIHMDVILEEEAKDLIANTPHPIKKVLLIKFPNREKVLKLIENLKPDVVQVQEDAPELETTIAIREMFPGIEIIKTFSVKDTTLIETLKSRISIFLPYIDAVCLDSDKPGKGKVIDEDLCAKISKFTQDQGCNYMLAGGINVDNLRQKVEKIKPNLVDIMSSVKLTPEIRNKLCAFKIKDITNIINDLNKNRHEI